MPPSSWEGRRVKGGGRNSAFEITREDNSLTVSSKEAGLGDEAQVHIGVSATVEESFIV